ncbi:hypothetical protein QQ25_06715 [Mycolicibacterium setense]|nr:hypothetical protein QQ25_06715 [Mycolicibacterium setense]
MSETGRLRLAQCIVDDGWSLRRAAERFQVAVTTAARWAGRSGIKGTLLGLRALPRFPQQDNLLARGQSSPLGQGTDQQFSATGRVSDYRVDEFVQAMSGQCGKAGFGTKPLDVGPDSG